MAQIRFREGTILGDTVIIPCFEFNYDLAKQEIPGAFNTSGYNTNGVVDRGGERFEKFKVISDQLYKYFPTGYPRPRSQYGDDGLENAILPMNMNIEANKTFDWAAKGFEVVTEEPIDLNTNPHYCYAYTSVPGGARFFKPIASYLVDESWKTDNNIQNLLDKEGKLGKVIFTEAGGHLAVFQSMYYTSKWQPKPVDIGSNPSATGTNSLSSERKVVYCVCNRNNVPIITTVTGNDRFSCYFDDYNTILSTSWDNDAIWNNTAQSFFFVHYTVNGEEMYGVCYAKFSGYGDNDYPQAIGVIGLGSEFWGTSIVPGGGGGEGEWGSKTVRGGGSGTFSTTASQRDKAVPGTAPADIVATINVNLDDKIFGSSDLSNDSKYCLQTFDETNWKHFIDVLYSDDFIKKYANAFYNPMSAIPVAHLLPEAFVDERLSGGGSGNKNKINVSAAGLTFTYEEGGGSLNVKSTKVYPMTVVKSEVLDLSATYYDAFPDYDGFTKITAHIPFIGDVPIDVNKVMGGRLQITLACDCQNGNLAAWIWTEDRDEQSDYTLIATGNCSYPLPVASMSSDPSAMGKIATGLISAIAGTAAIAAAPVTGGASIIAGGAAAIAGGSASAISGAVQMEHQKTTQVRYNNSGALALMTDPELWIDITRPVWVEPENYQALYGLPAYTGRTIMECPQKGNPEATQPFDGFLVIDSIDLTGIEGPTEEEKQMIEEQLAKGVFINYDHIGD